MRYKIDMKEFLITNAPIIGLLFFFSAFCFVIIYLLKPRTKKECEKHAQIPLKDDK